jgi:geranylgeranyl pyrophosphate synthase
MQPELIRLAEEVDRRLHAFVDNQPVREFYDLTRYEFGWTAAAGDDLVSRHLAALLCLACCEAAGRETEKAMALAMAVDLLQHFALVEDDLEQERQQRDGRPTLGARWGRAQAMNAADGLHALAKMALLEGCADMSAAMILELEESLDECCLTLCEATQRLLASGATTDAGVEAQAQPGASAEAGSPHRRLPPVRRSHRLG